MIPKTFIYKPMPGFFDISRKPDTLSTAAHRKLQWQQTLLSKVGNLSQWKYQEQEWLKWADFAAQLQQIILTHWSFDGVA